VLAEGPWGLRSPYDPLPTPAFPSPLLLAVRKFSGALIAFFEADVSFHDLLCEEGKQEVPLGEA
jgi:hypothetical protein